MAAWPASLPQFVSSDGYDESPPKTTIRSSVDVGIAKQRSRTTGGARPISATVEMTLAQVETLDVFFVTTLVNGSLSFTWVHPRTQVASTLRFTDVPKYPAESTVTFKVTLPLEIIA